MPRGNLVHFAGSSRSRAAVIRDELPNSWVLYKGDFMEEAQRVMAFVIKPLGKNIPIGFFGGDWARKPEGQCRHLDEIVPLSQQRRGFAFSAPRNSKGRTYVLAGRDDMTVAEVVKRLAAIRTGTGDGLVLSVG